MSLSWPVEAPVTQQFGTNPNSIQPNGHTGIDFAVSIGTPVYAADSGNVMFANWASILSGNNPWWIAPAYAGVCVVINHNDGFVTLYGHLNDTHLNDGEFVEKGALIGHSGNTGLSTGPHLHFEVLGWPLQPYNGYYGRVNPNLYVGGFAQAPEMQPNQRLVGEMGVRERTGASTTSAIGRTFKHGDILTFKGYVHGEFTNTTDLWFVGALSGTFFHAAAFTDGGVSGLVDLTPPKAPVVVGTTQRKAANVARYRKTPRINGELIHEYQPGDVLNFSHWTRGDNVNGNDVWFKGAISGGYAWSGAFEDHSTTGLTEESSSTPVPAPTPTPTPVVEKYSFTPDFDFVEYLPAGISNFQSGNFPQDQSNVVIHQFGTLGVDTLTSTINTFQNPNMERKASSHFVVSGKRIIQMVSLKDRAYHAGPTGNNYVGIETDPAQDADTIASTKKLLAALKVKYGRELTKHLHKNIPGNTTNCGASITLSKYDLEPVVPPVEPTPVPVPVPVSPEPTPAPEPIPDIYAEAVIDEFLGALKKTYFDKR